MSATSLAEILAEPWHPRRLPRPNREPRVLLPPQKYALLRAARGDWCYLCGDPLEGNRPVVDHVIPRSSFPSGQIDIADRSDNLRMACWSCNEAKSNYDYGEAQLPGVTIRCWYCRYCPYDEDDDWSDGHGEWHRRFRLAQPVTAWCGRCRGYSDVPDHSWIL